MEENREMKGEEMEEKDIPEWGMERQREMEGTGGGQPRRRRRKKRTFREGLQNVLACEVTDEVQWTELKEMGLEPTYLNQILRAVAEKAARGELDAARYLRDIAVDKKGTAEETKQAPLWDGDLTALTDGQLRVLVAAADRAGGKT